MTNEEKETMRNCFLNEKDSPYWVMILICFLFFGHPNLNIHEFFDKIELPKDKRPKIPFIDENGKYRSMTEEEQKIYLKSLKEDSQELDSCSNLDLYKERNDSDENLS